MSRRAPALFVATSVLFATQLAACKGGGAKEQVKAEYAQTLPKVLDMVGENPDGYLAIRDMKPFLEQAKQVQTIVDGPIDRLLTMVEQSGEKVDRAEFEAFRKQFDAVMAAVEGSGIAWDQGMVVHGEKGGKGMVLFKAESLDGLGPILTALEEDPAQVQEHCAKLDADPTWFACGESAEVAKAFKPAKQGAALVAALEHDLVGVDFDRVNAAMNFDFASMVMSTDPGLYDLAVFPKEDVPPEFSKVAGKGPAKALRLLSPGDTFTWGRIDMAGAKAQAGGVPAPAQAMVDAFDGEVLMAGVSEPKAFIFQMGVTDPYPVRSVLDLGWTQKDNIPTSLPDLPGLSWSFVAEELEVAGEKTRVLRAILEGEEVEQVKAYSDPSVSAWVGGGYLSAAVGVDLEGVKALANAKGEGPSDDFLNALPPSLAAQLRAGDVAFAYHASFDGLQSPALLAELEKNWAKVDLPDKPEFDAFEGVMHMFAPISEISAWVSDREAGPVFHVALRTFGDAHTEEGQAALAAMEAIHGGTPAAEAYGSLAKKYAKSHRAHAYEARASADLSKASVGGVAALGVAAAVAIPAFTKYQRRSREAMMEMEEAQMKMEAEMRALEEAEAQLELPPPAATGQ